MAYSVNRRRTGRRATAEFCGLWLLSGLLALPLQARAGDTATPGAPAAAASLLPGKTDDDDDYKPAWAGDLMTRSNLMGDIGGLRPLLDRYGRTFGLSETTEVLGNPNGGGNRAPSSKA